MPSCEPGAELGHYRIIRLLGRGGMGEVYLARDLTLERDVAIKLLHAEGGAPGVSRDRLLREAQAAAALDHPNICTVYEVGETADGRAFIAMQYVEGETLAAVLRRGPMTARDAMALGAQITDALAAAHKRGIIHRDLKPQNVILTATGRPTLLDFGLARGLPAPSLSPEAPTRSAQTLAGVVKGTPGYMSPEHLQQRPIDARSDLFALGALLFECLTGRRAFGGTTSWETFGQILHVHPPPVSSLRSGLDERHDELCRRLLAKDPADRFQSADEVTGALRLLMADSSRDAAETAHPPASAHDAPHATGTNSTNAGVTGNARRRWVWPALAAGTMAAIAAALAGWWIWNSSRTLPPIPSTAARWYERGVEAIREGAYHSGQMALQEAIQLFPRYPLAHARLAEALKELDDEQGAQAQLLRLASVLPDESRLGDDERLRLQGTRSLVLRDFDASLAAYRGLAGRNPGDATAWLELGRVQEAAGGREDAGASYVRAIAIDPQYAAARLRLGVVEGQQSRQDEALAAFAESERLYRAAASTEGEAEVLLSRGRFRYAQGDLAGARADLERALSLASSLKGTHQLVRARMALSSVTATEGRFAESERMASEAVQQALDAGLDTVAADGLTDLAATLMESARLPEAAAQGERAIQLADRRGAQRTAARARLQLAAVRLRQGGPQDALALCERALAFLKPNKYRRLELFGLSLMSGAFRQMNDLDRARAISTDVLATAEGLRDEVQTGIALTSLASLAAALGQFPQALAYRERAEAIRRRQHDASALPYDLANRAELLIYLGRPDDASWALDELDAGIKAGIDAYVGRARRAALLRALAAVTSLRLADALRHLRAIPPSTGADAASVLAPVFTAYAEVRLGRRSGSGRNAATSDAAPPAPALADDWRYWRAATFLAEGNSTRALAEAESGLRALGDAPNDELRWRLSAIATLALRARGETARSVDMLGRTQQALARLRSSWSGGSETYEKRPDLAELKARLVPKGTVTGG